MYKHPGPTGQFPKGKVIPEDEGELAIGFRVGIGLEENPVVVIEFGKATEWIGLEPDMVDEFCEILQEAKKKAFELANPTEKTVD